MCHAVRFANGKGLHPVALAAAQHGGQRPHAVVAVVAVFRVGVDLGAALLSMHSETPVFKASLQIEASIGTTALCRQPPQKNSCRTIFPAGEPLNLGIFVAKTKACTASISSDFNFPPWSCGQLPAHQCASLRVKLSSLLDGFALCLRQRRTAAAA